MNKKLLALAMLCATVTHVHAASYGQQIDEWANRNPNTALALNTTALLTAGYLAGKARLLDNISLNTFVPKAIQWARDNPVKTGVIASLGATAASYCTYKLAQAPLSQHVLFLNGALIRHGYLPISPFSIKNLTDTLEQYRVQYHDRQQYYGSGPQMRAFRDALADINLPSIPIDNPTLAVPVSNFINDLYLIALKTNLPEALKDIRQKAKNSNLNVMQALTTALSQDQDYTLFKHAVKDLYTQMYYRRPDLPGGEIHCQETIAQLNAVVANAQNNNPWYRSVLEEIQQFFLQLTCEIYDASDTTLGKVLHLLEPDRLQNTLFRLQINEPDWPLKQYQRYHVLRIANFILFHGQFSSSLATSLSDTRPLFKRALGALYNLLMEAFYDSNETRFLNARADAAQILDDAAQILDQAALDAEHDPNADRASMLHKLKHAIEAYDRRHFNNIWEEVNQALNAPESPNYSIEMVKQSYFVHQNNPVIPLELCKFINIVYAPNFPPVLMQLFNHLQDNLQIARDDSVQDDSVQNEPRIYEDTSNPVWKAIKTLIYADTHKKEASELYNQFNKLITTENIDIVRNTAKDLTRQLDAITTVSELYLFQFLADITLGKTTNENPDNRQIIADLAHAITAKTLPTRTPNHAASSSRRRQW